MKPYIKFTRYPYEEPYHLNLIVEATNGINAGYLDYYCNASDLEEISEALIKFPSKVPDEYIYEAGSESAQSAYYLKLRCYTIDSLGHCAIQLKMNNNSDCPNESMCEFSIKADAADIIRLGQLIKIFSLLVDKTLIWTITDGELK